MSKSASKKQRPARVSKNRRRPIACIGLEALEQRALLTAVFPTNFEQYLVEVINRARANPAAEAARFSIDLNEGLPAGTITTAPKQPLAINPFLVDSSRGHSQWMTDHNLFQHPETDSNHIIVNQPQDRMAASGYVFGQSYSNGENIAAQSQVGATPLVATINLEHSGLFIDSTESDRGHRTNMMDDSFAEIGTGMAIGPLTYNNNQTLNSLLITEDFASTADHTPFITGVIYADNDHDNFYSVGEGIGGITITATPVGGGAPIVTTTWGSGGYSLMVPNGTYNIAATGSGFTEMDSSGVVVSNQNVKVDFVPGLVPPTGVTASDAAFTDKVRVTWNATSGATSYDVFRGTTNNSSAAVKINATSVVGTTYDDSTAVFGTTYFYFVVAKNATTSSSLSGSDSGTVAQSAPAAPTGLTASDGAYTDKVRLFWSTTPGATAYEVWRSTTNSSASATKINPSDVTLTTYDDTTATPGTTYFYFLKAKNAAGPSGFSASDSGFSSQAVPIPATPSGVSATDSTFTDKVRVTWTASPGATAYEVWRTPTNSSSSASHLSGPDVTTTTYDDTTAVAGTTYFYFIKAKNSTGTSDFSASDSGVRQQAAAQTGVFPTAADQYFLEIINRDRADPVAAAAFYGIDLNEGLAAGTISDAAKQPMAFNPFLTDAAIKHSQWQSDNVFFTHYETTNGDDFNGPQVPGMYTPQQRDVTAGYSTPGGLPGFENIAWFAPELANPPGKSDADKLHKNLFVDSGTAQRGHRTNLMNPSLVEAGIGMIRATTKSGSGTIFNNAALVTEDFASGGGPFLTGVVYTDDDHDNFYTPGEGLGAITITATPTSGGAPFVTTTWDAGGYSLKVPSGTYNITATAPGTNFVAMEVDGVVVAGLNVEEDFVPGAAPAIPLIAVQGGATPIASGDTTPAVSDGTLFAASAVGTAVAHSFTIKDTGGAALHLMGNPIVAISGANASDFTVVTQPGSTVGANNGSVTFQIQFNPSAIGVRTATVSIASDDAAHSPFTFDVSGTGAAPDLIASSVTVVGPDVLVPTDKIKVVVHVVNQGGLAVTNGAMTIKLYASADNVLDKDGANPDAFVSSIAATKVNLPANGGNADFNFNLTIGAANPGDYFFIADVDTEAQITESNENNNTGATAAPSHVVWEFGNVGSRKNVKGSFVDQDGTAIIFSLSGAGTGTIAPDASVTVDNADATTAVAITTKKSKTVGDDGQAQISNLTINGSAKSFTAPGINVLGNILVTGTIAKLQLNNILNPQNTQQTLTISGAQATPAPTAVLTFGRIGELTLSSPLAGIKSLTAVSWTDANATADVITTTSIGTVSIKGDKKNNVVGAFGADVILTDALAAKSLSSFTATDTVTSTIRAASNIGTVTVGALVNSVIYAGVDAAATGLPASDKLGSKTIAGLTVKGITGLANSFVNSFVAAGTITKVSLHDVKTTNDTSFGFAAHVIKSIKRLDAPKSIKLPPAGTAGDADLNVGDAFVIQIEV